MRIFIANNDLDGAKDLRILISKAYDRCFAEDGAVINFPGERNLERACVIYHDHHGMDTSVCWEKDCAICGDTKLGLVYKATKEWQELHQLEINKGSKHQVWCDNTDADPATCWNCKGLYTQYPSGVKENSEEVRKLA